MSNFSKSKWGKALSPIHDPRAMMIRSGWEDVRADKPWRKDFDKLDYISQNNYEAGRRVAACLSRHMTLPFWPPDQPFEELVPTLPTQAAADDFRLENALTMGVKAAA